MEESKAIHEFKFAFLEEFVGNARPEYRDDETTWPQWINEAKHLDDLDKYFLLTFIEDEYRHDMFKHLSFVERAMEAWKNTPNIGYGELACEMMSRLRQHKQKQQEQKVQEQNSPHAHTNPFDWDRLRDELTEHPL